MALNRSEIVFLRGTSDQADFFEFIRVQGVTVDMLSGMACDPDGDMIRTVYASGRLDQAAQGAIPYETDPEVISCIPVNYITLLEMTAPVQFKRTFVLRLVGDLREVRSRLGKKVDNEIYFAGQARRLPCQYVIYHNTLERIIMLSEPGGIGISSVRLDEPRQRLIGIRSDGNGLGTAIVSMPRDKALNNPDKMASPQNWTELLSANSLLPFLSLSRPFALHKGGRFVVDCVNDEHYLLRFTEDGRAEIHSSFLHPGRIIGAPGFQNPSTVVTYQPRSNGTAIEVVKIHQTDHSPLAQLIL